MAIPLVASLAFARVQKWTAIDGAKGRESIRAQSTMAPARWRPSHGTLRVWIADAPVNAATSDRRDAATRAFTAWEITDTSIRFDFTTDSAAADIALRWTERFDAASDTSFHGLTTYETSSSGNIVRASITIALRRANGHRLTSDALEAMAMHEVGHALGLGHSVGPADIMSPSVRVMALSEFDRAAVRTLYQPRDDRDAR